MSERSERIDVTSERSERIDVTSDDIMAVEPPVAPTRPHEWKRPTGVVEDPWAWLADRDDPETIAYLEAENAYADHYFAEPERAALVGAVFEEIKSRVQETDLSVPVFHGG